MPAPTDMDINAAVRRILVQHRLDLGQLSVRSTRGVVRVHGTVAKLRDLEQCATPEEIATITSTIQNIRDVRRLQWDCSNVTSNNLGAALAPSAQTVVATNPT